MNIVEFDYKELDTDIRAKIEQICTTVYKKDIKNLTRDEVIELVSMDMAMFAGTMNVYVSNKRKTEVQFSMNDYGAGMTFNLEGTAKIIQQAVEAQSSPELMIAKYIKMRGLFYSLLTQKYATNEAFLRHLCRQAEIKDGIPGVGRDK